MKRTREPRKTKLKTPSLPVVERWTGLGESLAYELCSVYVRMYMFHSELGVSWQHHLQHPTSVSTLIHWYQ